MSNDFDKACRSLIREPASAAAVVRWLLGGRPEDVRFMQWLDTRRVTWPGGPDREGDSVAWVQDLAAGGAPFLIVIEFQIDPDARMTGRLLTYMGGLLTEYRPTDLPGDEFGVLSIVVNLRGTGNSSRDMRLKAGRPGLFTSLGVGEVNLKEMDAAATVEAAARGEVPRAVLALVPLMRGGQDAMIIPRWREVADQEQNADIRHTLGSATVFAEAAGCENVWEAGLKGWNEMRSKVADGWRAEGFQEGRQEGEMRASRAKLLRLLAGRFGPVPPDIEQRIAGADLAALDRYFDAAITGTLEEFRNQL